MRTADEFNDLWKPGHPVIVRKDNGDEVQTKTTSKAWDMCGSPVVMLDGISGAYLLDRVFPMEMHSA